ncbi:MAG: rRNA maturation RNase YbeY [bacterium]
MIAVSIRNTTRRSLPIAHLRRFAFAVLKEFGVQGELCISFVGEKTIKQLNRKFLRRRGATDVISFSMDDWGAECGVRSAEWGEILIGDVVICVLHAERDAMEEGISLRRKLEILVLHGILHIMGYDHEKETDRIKMEAKEKQIWNALKKKRKK